MSYRGLNASSLHSKQLGEILVEQGSITAGQLNQALELQEGCDSLLGQLLVRMKFCAAEAIASALHKQVKITDIKLNRVKINPDAATHFTRLFCEEHKLLPFEVVGDLICVTMANPLNRSCIDIAQKNLLGLTIKIFHTPWPDIHKAIEPTFAAVEQAAAAAAVATTAKATAKLRPVTGALARPEAGPSHYAATATTQPGFEHPPSAHRKDVPVATAASAQATPAAVAVPPRPLTPPRLPQAPPAAVVDGSWVETKQNPHIVFHQRMVITMADLAAPPGFLRSLLDVEHRRQMIVLLGLLLAEHGGLLPQSVDFTLGPDDLKMLEWRALVLRGLFCYHMSYPYLFAAAPRAFHIVTPQDVVDSYDKVREHPKLFLKELGSVNEQAGKLVHCSRAEIDHTAAHLERLFLLLSGPAPAPAAP